MWASTSAMDRWYIPEVQIKYLIFIALTISSTGYVSLVGKIFYLVGKISGQINVCPVKGEEYEDFREGQIRS